MWRRPGVTTCGWGLGLAKRDPPTLCVCVEGLLLSFSLSLPQDPWLQGHKAHCPVHGSDCERVSVHERRMRLPLCVPHPSLQGIVDGGPGPGSGRPPTPRGPREAWHTSSGRRLGAAAWPCPLLPLLLSGPHPTCALSLSPNWLSFLASLSLT